MKNCIILICISLLVAACGTSKNVAQQTETTTAVTQTGNTQVTDATEETQQVTQVMVNEMEDKSNEDVVAVVEEEIEIEPSVIEAFDHTSWDGLLQKYISAEGNVNYSAFRNERNILQAYIVSLGENMPAENWTKEDKLAYWMNAYNAMTVDLILRNYPLASIKDIKDPWNQRLWKLGEKWYNLDEIEHKILRKMGDPRIHFGINCASFSCPTIGPRAFTAQLVDEQLDWLAKNFINDTQRNTITENSVEISKIFSWFAKDFKEEGTIIDFLNRYSDVTINNKAKKSFKKYDWSLNE